MFIDTGEFVALRNQPDRVGHRTRASGAIEVVRIDVAAEEDAWDLLERHDDKRRSYVDATSFALMARGHRRGVRFDRHFTQRALRVHPTTPPA